MIRVSCKSRLLSIPREIFENVVAGFAAVTASPVENVKYIAAKKRAQELGQEVYLDDDEVLSHGNQIILSGTAFYDFNHFAEYWKKWLSIIQSN